MIKFGKGSESCSGCKMSHFLETCPGGSLRSTSGFSCEYENNFISHYNAIFSQMIFKERFLEKNTTERRYFSKMGIQDVMNNYLWKKN